MTLMRGVAIAAVVFVGCAGDGASGPSTSTDATSIDTTSMDTTSTDATEPDAPTVNDATLSETAAATETVVDAADGTASETDTAAEVVCSGHGAFAEGWPVCACDDGYRPLGSDCVPATCTELAGPLAFDLQPITVGGALRINGTAPATLPAGWTVTLAFTDGDGSARFAVGSGGHYGGVILPGTYDISYCASIPLGAASGGLPINCDTVSRKQVTLTESTTLDLDLTSVPIAGTVTLDGAPPHQDFPEESFSLRVRPHGIVSLGNEVAVASDGTFATEVLAGEYDLYYDGFRVISTAMPINVDRLVKSNVTPDGHTPIAIDIATALVSGRVTVNGTPATHAGWVQVTHLTATDAPPEFGRDQESAVLENGDYAFRLIRGTYRLECYAPNGDLQLAPMDAAASIEADTTRDVDFPTVDLAGKLTITGVQVPAVNMHLSFAGRTTGPHEVTVWPDLSFTPSFTYQVTLLADTYDVYLESGGLAGFPTVGGLVRQGVQVTKASGGTLDLDVPAATLTVQATVSGGPISRPTFLELKLAGATAPNVHVAVPADGVLPVLVALGTYDILYDGVASDTTLPRNDSFPLASGVVVAGDVTRAVDIQSRTVSGTFTLAGAPPASGEPPSVLLAFQERSHPVLRTPDSRTVALHGSAFSLPLLPGDYFVHYQTRFGQAGTAPANESRYLGCVRVK